MPLPRCELIDRDESGYYHCISRCVRRAFLCGGEFEHRRAWIEDRARDLASIFALDVCTFAVLDNHYHVIFRNEPEVAKEWSAAEVQERWKRLFPKSARRGRRAAPGAKDREKRTRVLRKRLCDLSWFMRCLNEYVARRANLEDDCKGRFWEGRFKSIHLVDEAALLACSIYVDLNPIRASISETPETSRHTSIHNRILVKQLHESRRGVRAKAPKDVDCLITHHGEAVGVPARRRRKSKKKGRGGSVAAPPRADEAGIWMTPIEIAPSGSPKPKTAAARRRRGLFNMTVSTYLGLVDDVGRVMKANAGSIAEHHRPILERLQIDPDRLADLAGSAKRLHGTVAGAVAKVAEEAKRRKRSRAIRTFDVDVRTT